MPTNSTPNPTETRFSVPIAVAAKSSVSIRPRPSVARIGTISRQLPTARASQSAISATLPISPVTVPSATVANCVSASATGPVIRTCAAPLSTKGSFAAAARMAAVAAPPGWSEW